MKNEWVMKICISLTIAQMGMLSIFIRNIHTTIFTYTETKQENKPKQQCNPHKMEIADYKYYKKYTSDELEIVNSVRFLSVAEGCYGVYN
jgi:hypothetical protein